MLNVLWERDGQSGAEIGARLVLDSATITGLLDRMEAGGQIERRPDAVDRRVNRVFLTSSGRHLKAPLNEQMDAMNAEIAKSLGGDAAAFWNMLGRVGEVRGA